MPQETDAERIPLLRGPYHNINNNNNDNSNRHRSCLLGFLGYGFIIVATLLLSINIIFYLIESNEQVLLKGNSKIPYEYYLSLESDNWSRFEYVIETSPSQNDSKLSKLFSTNTQDLTEDRVKLAKIVSRNYKAWNPAYYEVREVRNNSQNDFTLLTTQAHMGGLWFIVWPPKVHITFALNDDKDENKGDNDGGRKTRRIVKDDDLEKLLKCEYEITWNYKYFGEIYRKCPNQENWDKIAYVKGSSEWGMQWLDPERIETYGIVTKPAQGKNRHMRSIVIRPDSPFPPIIPALYVAYYDRVINRGDPDGRTNLLI